MSLCKVKDYSSTQALQSMDRIPFIVIILIRICFYFSPTMNIIVGVKIQQINTQINVIWSRVCGEGSVAAFSLPIA